MKKLNQKGMGHLLVIVFVVLFAGLASFALMRTFAARGGSAGGGGKKSNTTPATTVAVPGSDLELVSWSSGPSGSVVQEQTGLKGKSKTQDVFEIRSSYTSAGPTFTTWNEVIVPWLHQNLDKQVRVCAKVKVLSAVRTVEISHGLPVHDDSTVDNFLVAPGDSYTEYCSKPVAISYFDDQKIFNRGSASNSSWDYSANMELPGDGVVRIQELTYKLL